MLQHPGLPQGPENGGAPGGPGITLWGIRLSCCPRPSLALKSSKQSWLQGRTEAWGAMPSPRTSATCILVHQNSSPPHLNFPLAMKKSGSGFSCEHSSGHEILLGLSLGDEKLSNT